MSLIIREVIEADCERVTELSRQLGYEVMSAETLHRIRKISLLEDHKIFVAELNKEVVGWAHIREDSPSLLSSPRAELVGLVVDERVRSSGIGKSLLQASERWAQSRNLSAVRLLSNIKREKAHNFYIREGYVIEKTSLRFKKYLIPRG